MKFSFIGLIKDETSIGQHKADFDVAKLDWMPINNRKEVSKIHFKIYKNDVTDTLSPVFLVVKAIKRLS